MNRSEQPNRTEADATSSSGRSAYEESTPPDTAVERGGDGALPTRHFLDVVRQGQRDCTTTMTLERSLATVPPGGARRRRWDDLSGRT